MRLNKWNAGKPVRFLRIIGVWMVCLFLLPVGVFSRGKVDIVDLRCEYLETPLGIDAETPRLGWKMESKSRHSVVQTAYQILVASSPELLKKDVGDLWDSDKVSSSRSIQIAYEGTPLRSMQQCWWKVRVWNQDGQRSAWSKPARWGMGILTPDEWRAQWIGDEPDMAQRDYLDYIKKHNGRREGIDNRKEENPPRPASPLLRKDFRLDKPVKYAVLYASALGYYEMRINGERVDERVMAPEWTDYYTRVQYQAYDLTARLKKGGNALSAILADGWCLGTLAPIKWRGGNTFPFRGFYANDRRLIAQLLIAFEDGTRQLIPTDGSWKINPDGYILRADNFMGQTIDARKMLSGWDMPGFNDAAWKNVFVDGEVERNLVAQANEPIRVHRRLKPVSIRPWKDKYIVDFGQNIAGWCTLKIKGQAGREITIRHGEWLNDDGSIYTTALGHARSTDTFILSGGEDFFEPRFTYHGFQYAEISGLDEAPTADMITANAISSDPAVTGTFECSNPKLNQLFSNILWTQRNNTLSVMTDNPSRDERTGALGDVQIFCQNAMFNMDMPALMSKICQDVRDAVGPNGQYFSMAPSIRHGDFGPNFIGAPGWTDAGLILPWRMYENYADVTVMQKQYESMKRHIEATLRENPSLVWKVRHNHNGDWLNANTIHNPPEAYDTTRGATPDDVFSTAFFAYSTRLLAQMAAILNRRGDAARYDRLATDIKKVYQKLYIAPDGKIEGDTQGTYSISLAFGLVPEELRAHAFQHLVRCIEEYDYRISTGFISTPLMMEELVKGGRTDIAYRLLESERFPSWIYSINQGATTLWERWDAYVKGRGINPDHGMNSYDHFAYGSVGEWLYRHVLGINPDIDHPGYAHFTIRPRPGGSLTWAKGSYESIRGEIASAWCIEDNRFILRVRIPANTSATVFLPTAYPEKITLKGVKNPDYRKGTDETSVRLGPGEYEFVVRDF